MEQKLELKAIPGPYIGPHEFLNSSLLVLVRAEARVGVIMGLGVRAKEVGAQKAIVLNGDSRGTTG